MEPRIRLAADSRDGHLALRRAERQQQLIEFLASMGTARSSTSRIAHDLGVSMRTVERDIERLRDAGLPIRSTPGRGGGHSLPVAQTRHHLTLDTAEIAAIISSLAIVGPTSSPSATSAMAALTRALQPGR
ncbi:MAG: HTH domain-containing protein [Dermatophilus congolensis]|nr:HTH domain-containing protein [Dermatophilus congolensis]